MKTGLHLFGTTTTARRREVRRAMGHDARPWRQWLSRREAFWATVYLAVFIVLAGLIAVQATQRIHYSVTQIVPHTVVARVPFSAKDSGKSIQAQEEAAAETPNVYKANPRFFADVREQLDDLLKLAGDPNYQNVDQIPASTLEALHLQKESLAELRQMAVNGQPQPEWIDITHALMHDLARVIVLTPDRAAFETDERRVGTHKIDAQPPEGGDVLTSSQYVISLTADRDIQTAVTSVVDHLVAKPLRQPIIAAILQRPAETYQFDKVTSDQRKAAAAKAAPPVQKKYDANETIVSAGQELTHADVDHLEMEREAYWQALAARHAWLPWMIGFGRIAMVSLVILILWGYILAYNPRLFRNPLRGLALTGLLLLCLFLAVAVSMNNPRWVYITAIWPSLLASIVLAIAYDRRFAIAIGFMHAFMVLLVLGLPVEFGLVMLVGLSTAIGQLNEVSTRSKLVVTGILSGLAMAATTLITGVATHSLLMTDQALSLIAWDAFLALCTGVATGMIVEAVLPAIERLFNVTTAAKLKDLNDASHPLLRRLAQDAPGTLQHSLRVANMAEAAANAIAGNALLCKVGAMYHDIGKINKPLYFVENQAGGPNRHLKLSPAMSLLIIVGHVKDGIEMAREYRIPATIRQFIESHHGTTLVEYFYHEAQKKRDAHDAPAPSEFEFRYPGPKPQTREAAILMLCDGVEGAARAMPDPNAPRLEALVHGMAQKRLTDGQFDECNLTLQELHRIEMAVIKTLCAMYHGRIAYPKDIVAPDENATSSPNAAAQAG